MGVLGTQSIFFSHLKTFVGIFCFILSFYGGAKRSKCYLDELLKW